MVELPATGHSQRLDSQPSGAQHLPTGIDNNDNAFHLDKALRSKQESVLTAITMW